MIVDVYTQQNIVEVIVQSALMWCVRRPRLIVIVMVNEFPLSSNLSIGVSIDCTCLLSGRQEQHYRDIWRQQGKSD
eukprot:scaffold103604_cov70-Cyclotella_meneghiniana.AAC.1